MNVETPTSSGELSEALSVATEVALEAGALLREALYAGATVSEVEANGEVHALADLKAERLIRARLMARFPAWGMRSEEEPELNRPPEDERQRFWLVDPNDGTSAFVKGERGASVSIALIENGAPALGVIYAYMGLDDRGDLFTWARGCGPLCRNGAPLDPPSRWAERWEDVTVFVSNSADSIAQAYRDALQGARFRVAPGVAYRLALAASGEGDLATSLAGPRDFDYAAGHALLIGAGGRFVDERGRDVTYHPSRPERLGFGLGGAPGHVGRVLDLDWSAVLRREGQQRHGLRRPRHADLCSEPDLLTKALGAWWGWHLGWALGAGDEPSQLEASIEALCNPQRLTRAELMRLEARISQVGGDAELNAQVRWALSQEDASAWRALEGHPLAILIGQLAQGAPLSSGQEGSPYTRSACCLRLAQLGTSMRSTCSDGGRSWPQRLIGALLSYRDGDPSAWGSDSARLLEAWLTHLTHPGSSETGGADGVH